MSADAVERARAEIRAEHAEPGWEIVACANVHTQERAIEAATHFTGLGWRVRVDGEWGKPGQGGPVVVAERRICPAIERARGLAAAWANGGDPHPELLTWVHTCMMQDWDGSACGSATTTGMDLAWRVGARLCILDAVAPVGMHGVIPLCEAAGWPKPDGSPLT